MIHTTAQDRKKCMFSPTHGCKWTPGLSRKLEVRPEKPGSHMPEECLAHIHMLGEEACSHIKRGHRHTSGICEP